MPVSAMKIATLTIGEELVLADGPCVVTSVIVRELFGEAPTEVLLSGATDRTQFMSIIVPAGETFNWSGEGVAAGGGVSVACVAGDASIMVALR